MLCAKGFCGIFLADWLVMGSLSPIYSSWAYLKSTMPLAIAHRGGAGEMPENTMAAFDHARSLGFGYVELDVRATADGVLVVYHDSVLDTLTDRSGGVAELSWSEVREARVEGEEPVPRLEEVLDAWPDLRVNIDPKHPGAVEPLVKILRARDCAERVCISTFSDRRTLLVRRLLGNRYCTATTVSNIARIRAESLLPARTNQFGEKTAGPKAGCAQVPATIHGRRLVDERFVRTAHRHGLQVHVWTVNSASEMHSLLDIGVDGIMTDEVTLLRSVLIERGQWSG